jgi:glycosyltransferase involved in cell wall biosynthesis
MKLSVIIAFYNSHGAVKRQVKHFAAMNLPDDIEFIFVDDGSNPPHLLKDYSLKNLKLIHTHDKRPWTQGIARNIGSKLATGEYLLMTDIDHILSKEAIMDSYYFSGDKMIFPRYFGVLLEDGSLSQEPKVLEDYGLDMSRLNTKRGLYASVHGNTFTMKKNTFNLLGRYDPKHCLYGHHAADRQGEDSVLNRRWNHFAADNNIALVVGSPIYMFPIARYHVTGDKNPHGLFHNLSQELVPQPLKE